MSSTREIKKRIANVSSVEQLIKAMDMVSSTKLVRSRQQLNGVRPIYQELRRIIEEVGAKKEAKNHMFYTKREVKNSLYIVLTSNRGLAGGYNSNICKKTLEHINTDKNEKILVVGTKGYEYFRKLNKNIVHSIVDVSDANVYYGSENLANKILDSYLSDDVQEVFVAYTEFHNVLNYEPVIDRVLPIDPIETHDQEVLEMNYTPSVEVFIDEMIPLYLHMHMFRAFSEAHTSEMAARMVNMDAAGKNAEDILDDLHRSYNRKRQDAITQELNEIVGSASVLKKED